VRDLEELRSSITLVERNKDNIMYKNKLIALMEHICIKYNIDTQVMIYAKILFRIQNLITECTERKDEFTLGNSNRAMSLHTEICKMISSNYNIVKNMLKNNRRDNDMIYKLYNDVLYASNLGKSIFELSDNNNEDFEREYQKSINTHTLEHARNLQAISQGNFVMGGKYKKGSIHSRRRKSRRYHRKNKRKTIHKRKLQNNK
jgi:hypothetical protein